jgi:hypothetical protein
MTKRIIPPKPDRVVRPVPLPGPRMPEGWRFHDFAMI